MKLTRAIAVSVALLMGLVPSAFAWGPKANVAIVTTASRMISKESAVPLANLDKDIRRGAGTLMGQIATLIPGADVNPMHAIESEMYLLQAVRGSRVDPYYAYRLGVLGALVAEVSAPLYGTNPTYRNLYYADVEGNIDRVQLQSKRRVAVDPASYLSEVTSEAQGRADLIVSDYKSGLGFKGVAGAALSEDASRSVNAVADVMLTVLRGQVTVTNLSQGQIRDYVVDAIRFYIARNNDAETEAAYAKLMDLGVTTVDLQKQIGDMFYDAEKFERAMQEYKSVLAQAPSRRDVIERIADYYVRQGDDALSEKDLEGALASYNDALEADMLHPSAQSKKLEAQAMITERDARLEAQRRSLGQGDDLLRQADSLIFKQEYTEALTLLRQASTSYGEVTDEFPTEAQLARRGLLNATQRISQLQRDVVANAGSLSGLGATTGLRADAVEAAASVDQAALRQLVEAQYQAELAKLRAEYTAQ